MVVNKPQSSLSIHLGIFALVALDVQCIIKKMLKDHLKLVGTTVWGHSCFDELCTGASDNI